MSTPVREIFMDAALASLQAMWPDRHWQRGLVADPANLPEALLRKGVFCLVAGKTGNWAEYSGREGEYATQDFAIVAWTMLEGEGQRTLDGLDATTYRVEQLEAQMAHEVLEWCRAIKTGPLLDAVYPVDVNYSGGLDAPYGWIVFQLQGLYV